MLDLGVMGCCREAGQLGFDLDEASRPLTPSGHQAIQRIDAADMVTPVEVRSQAGVETRRDLISSADGLGESPACDSVLGFKITDRPLGQSFAVAGLHRCYSRRFERGHRLLFGAACVGEPAPAILDGPQACRDLVADELRVEIGDPTSGQGGLERGKCFRTPFRIGYVALTRAMDMFVLAVPETSLKEFEPDLQAAGLTRA